VTAPVASGDLLWVDAGGGASGDMILGALIDLGVPVRAIRDPLRTLPLEGWTLSARRIERAGLVLRQARVGLRRGAGAGGRTWRDIRKVIESGDIPAEPRRRALRVFRRLIEAEAEVHGRSPEQVHLHEAGAVDAIVDVVGACVGLDRLGVRRIVVSPLTTGFGSIRCSHGTYPVPAPATTLLVRGVPVRGGAIETERLTPTGAAILTTLADGYGPLPAMVPRAVGYGAGARDLGDDPNALRMVLGEPLAPTRERDAVRVVEFEVDDATPQLLAWAVERCLADGALDVFTTPVLMKKGRAGHLVTVLVRPTDFGRIAERILAETPTLGLRYRDERRVELERERVRVPTPYGKIAVKVGRIGSTLKAWPEFDDCATRAAQHGVPLREVQESALVAWRASKRSRRKR
jgi:uncharacterized protein (TIGR00299 family) protein